MCNRMNRKLGSGLGSKSFLEMIFQGDFSRFFFSLPPCWHRPRSDVFGLSVCLSICWHRTHSVERHVSGAPGGNFCKQISEVKGHRDLSKNGDCRLPVVELCNSLLQMTVVLLKVQGKTETDRLGFGWCRLG